MRLMNSISILVTELIKNSFDLGVVLGGDMFTDQALQPRRDGRLTQGQDEEIVRQARNLLKSSHLSLVIELVVECALNVWIHIAGIRLG